MGSLQVFLQRLGEMVPVEVPANGTVEDLAAAAEAATGIPAVQLQLTHAGARLNLEGGIQLSDLGVCMQSVIALDSRRKRGILSVGRVRQSVVLEDGSVCSWAGVGRFTSTSFGDDAVLAVTTQNTALLQSGRVMRLRTKAMPSPVQAHPQVRFRTYSCMNFYDVAVGVDLSGATVLVGSEKWKLGRGTSPPPSVADVACGGMHAVCLTASRGVAVWGADGEGQCACPPGLEGRVDSVAAGDCHSLAVLTDGTVRGWGRAYAVEGQPELRSVVQCAGGVDFSLALTEAGDIVGWGRKGEQVAAAFSDREDGPKRYVWIAASEQIAGAVTDDGGLIVREKGQTSDLTMVFGQKVAGVLM
eukprot:TRINITY_DN17473_c0_g1_i1.p2 TRINITY_DN17473_c0_g1~~TRINITY_DN17473_c0_g1_i1.p2  ORF type:complete len:358 (+),score=103.68 TRINITY_DN17473_c0_g1_i1:135-1208(+)